MPVAKVAYCILCEDYRVEKYNKLTILGFYGILPDVNIHVKEFGKAIEKLMFLLGISGEESADMSINILSPDDTILLSAPKVPIPLQGKKIVTYVGFIFGSVVFEQQGKYTLQLLIDNKEIRNSFTVDKGDPSLFI